MSESLTIEAIEPGRELAVAEPMRVAVIDPATAFLPVPWALIEEAAALISSCPGLAKEFADPANCRFVAYQAARWGMDPVAVATKTYFSPRKNGGLVVGYEAQLVHALIETDPELAEPMDFIFGYAHATNKQATFRYCKAVGILRGASRPRTLTTPTVGQIKVKNSPLWFSDPDQQLSYYAARAWARRFRPGRILGVYARDELLIGDDAAPRRPFFDDETAAPFDGIPPEPPGRDGGGPGAAPPEQGDSAPEGIEQDKAWVHAERDRILEATDPKAVAEAGNRLIGDKRFKRVKSYDQGLANAVDRAIRGRIDELNAGRS